MNIKKLFALADRAKTIGGGQDYALPNTIWAVLLDSHYKNPNQIILSLETQDDDGKYQGQSWYDLLTLSHKSEEGVDLTIPLPLVGVVPATDFVKKAVAAGRVFYYEHRREHGDANPGEKEFLWEELLKEVPMKDLVASARRNLSAECFKATGLEAFERKEGEKISTPFEVL